LGEDGNGFRGTKRGLLGLLEALKMTGIGIVGWGRNLRPNFGKDRERERDDNDCGRNGYGVFGRMIPWEILSRSTKLRMPLHVLSGRRYVYLQEMGIYFCLLCSEVRLIYVDIYTYSYSPSHPSSTR